MEQMTLPAQAHLSQPWRIHELTPDFRLEDVWALPTPGGRDDFPRLVELVTSFDPARSSSAPVRTLFAIRSTVGELLRIDRPGTGHPFKQLYLTDRECALEIVNRTVHGVLHLGWVGDDAGGYRGQMAVLVKPNGRLGELYMGAIRPFRHRIVYPQILRELGRAWATGGVRQIAVPAAARELSTLAHVDYADTFLMETGGAPDRTAEQWARLVLEDAPAATRTTLLSGWASLGLKVGRPGSAGSVLGWQVRSNTLDHVLLRADSRIGMPGELLFKREPDALLFSTFVQYDNPAARALWAGVEHVHVPIVRRLLEQAGRR
jgi:hypothetical protein